MTFFDKAWGVVKGREGLTHEERKLPGGDALQKDTSLLTKIELPVIEQLKVLVKHLPMLRTRSENAFWLGGSKHPGDLRSDQNQKGRISERMLKGLVRELLIND